LTALCEHGVGLRDQRFDDAHRGIRAVVARAFAGRKQRTRRGAISRSKDIGAAAAFDRRIGGRTLEFRSGDGGYVDRQTGSKWDITGRAIDGPLKGERLRPLRHDQQFWFALAAFLPEAKILR